MAGSRITNDDYRMSPEHIDMRRLRNDHDIARIAGLVVPLVRHADGLRGPCPLHEERTASFIVDERTQTFRCEACGASGDVIDLVRLQADCSHIMACEWLMGSHRTCPTADFAAVRAAAGRRALAVGNARAIWRAARLIAGSPAEAYLRSLSLDPQVPGGIRFADTPVAFDEATGRSGPCRPALVAACQDVDGTIVGVHRTFLDEQGAPIHVKRATIAIGQVQGTAVRFGPHAATIVLCGKVEEGLAFRQILPEASVWVAISAGGLAETVLPLGTRRVVLAGRGDRTDAATIARARAAFAAKRMRVDVIRPSGDHATFAEAVAAAKI